jgi:hypothetical protein
MFLQETNKDTDNSEKCAAFEQIEDKLFHFSGDNNSFPQQARESNLTQLLVEIARSEILKLMPTSFNTFVSARQRFLEKKPLFIQKNFYVKYLDCGELNN